MIHKGVVCPGDRPTLPVTFSVPDSIWAEKIHLVGDFNDWNWSSHPLTRDREHRWAITVSLEPNKAYQFRYLVDGSRWTNDDDADAYVFNAFGSDNFVVITDPEFKKYNGG